MTSTQLVVALILLSFASYCLSKRISHNVIKYGAKPDGRTDSTDAFLAAWSQACSSIYPSTLHVPPGRFLLGNIVFNGKCNNSAILFLIDGTLVAPWDYTQTEQAENWILFENVDGVSVFGGVLDGQGAGLWNCKATSKHCPPGATSLRFSKSSNVAITGLTSINSQIFHVVIHGCQTVRIDGIKVFAPAQSPNTDGIHVQMSSDVSILNSQIGTGDDCISIGPGTSRLWIQNIDCGPGHGISIGSLGKEFYEGGVQNVTVSIVRFTGTENGLRIKSWARPSTGFANNIVFQDANMNDVSNPIIIDQSYCPHKKHCPEQGSGVRISNVSYQGIYGKSATKVATKFECSKSNPCTGIKMDNVHLTYKNQAAYALCNNADATSSPSVEPAPSCL